MSKKVIIYGTGTIGTMLYYDSLKHPDFKIACFTTEEKYLIDSKSLLSVPLINSVKIAEMYPPDEYDMIVAVGGYDDVRSRAEAYNNARVLGYRLRNYISPFCDIAPDVEMGDNNIIFAQSHVGLGGIMGSNNLIRQQVYLGHDFRVGDHNVFAPGTKFGGRCIVENSCYVGLGATVIDSRKIAEETLIGAGSVVIKDTEPYSKNVGNPSRVIGYHREEGIKMRRRNG